MPSLNKFFLYCLPFSGGNSYSYNSLQQHLSADVLIRAPELPGRNNRLAEPLLTDLQAMCEDIFNQFRVTIGHHTYAIYGHSMGALLGYLLVRKVLQYGLPKPLQLFVSGAPGPGVPRPKPHRHIQPKQVFIEYVKSLGGLPDEVLNTPEAMDFYETILRADIQAVETSNYPTEPILDIPITLLQGLQDNNIGEADALAWQAVTSQPLRILRYPGKHFFINQHRQEIADLFSKTLDSVVTRC